MPETVLKSFWYKRCVFKLKSEGLEGEEVTLGKDQQLSHLLLRAIGQVGAIGRSHYDNDDDSATCNFINECEALPDKPEVVCGEFLGFQKNRPQLIINTEKGEKTYPIEAVLPKPGTQNGDSPAIFIAYRNHLAIMTSGRFQAAQLEQYLRWFLTEKTKVLPNTHEIYLTNRVSSLKDASTGIKKIKMGVFTEASKTKDSIEDARVLNEQNALIAKAFEKLFELMGQESEFKEINNGLKNRRLRLSVQLSTLPPRKGEVETNLDGVATLMRHQIKNVQLFTNDGKKWKDNQLYIMDKVECPLSPNGTFARLEIGAKLNEWLSNLNVMGKIDFGL